MKIQAWKPANFLANFLKLKNDCKTQRQQSPSLKKSFKTPMLWSESWSRKSEVWSSKSLIWSKIKKRKLLIRILRFKSLNLRYKMANRSWSRLNEKKTIWKRRKTTRSCSLSLKSKLYRTSWMPSARIVASRWKNSKPGSSRCRKTMNSIVLRWIRTLPLSLLK